MGFIKKLLLIILLSVSFILGYCLGNKPDSPDIIKWCRDKYKGLVNASKNLPEQLSWEKFTKK